MFLLPITCQAGLFLFANLPSGLGVLPSTQYALDKSVWGKSDIQMVQLTDDKGMDLGIKLFQGHVEEGRGVGNCLKSRRSQAVVEETACGG